MMARKSVVLVTVDCLRADHCGFMGYRRPTTPFLDGLAAESFVFPTAIVTGVPTFYSFPGILASRYPLDLGREVLGLAVREKNLASTLRDDGYATAFFGAANPYLLAQFGYDFGFDTFHDFLKSDLAPVSALDAARGSNWAGGLNRLLENVSRKIPGMGTAYDELYFEYCQRWAAPRQQSLDTLRRFPAADVIIDRAQTWLASVGSKPFFLWLHLMDPHSPYYPTEKGLTMLGADQPTSFRVRYLNEYWNRSDLGTKRLRRYRNEVIDMYDAGICWADAQLSRLVETLRRRKLWDDCVFALTADHGEEFLEHDGRYHAPALAEELIHVPLLLRVPGASKKTLPGKPFSLLNLAPTLLAAAGSPVPDEFQGQSQWTNIQRGTEWSEPAIAECVAQCTNPYHPEQRRGARLLTVRDARYKLLLNFDNRAKKEEMFDLDADPGERSPLADDAARPERRRLLQAALAHLRRSACLPLRNSESYLLTRLREIGQTLARTAIPAGVSASGPADPSRAG